MVESTEFGVGYTKVSLIRRVGIAAGITDIDFLTPAEIRRKLGVVDPETSGLLEAFLNVFDRWFLYTRMIERRITSHDAQLEAERTAAVERRAAAQSQLAKRLLHLEAKDSR